MTDVVGTKAPIDATELELAAKPPLESFTFPPHYYTSPDIYEIELDHLFAKAWQCVGRVEDVPNVGDFFTREIGPECVIVVRDAQGAIRAHINFCRHRGCQVAQGEGNTKAFRCPYHGWMYGLDGELRAAPEFKETVDFNKKDYPLYPVKAEVWQGFIFINLDADAEPFAPQMTDTEKFGLGLYDMEGQVTTHRWEYKLDCNWKAYVENFHEEYHVPWVHAETFQEITPMKCWAFFPDLTDQPWQLFVGQVPEISMSDTGEALFPFNPELKNLPDEFAGMPIWLGHPTFMCINAVDSTVYYVAYPDGPEKTTIILRLMVPGEVAQKYFDGDPEIVPQVQQYARNTEIFIDEDNKIGELQHKGLRSRIGGAGRQCRHELGAYAIHEYMIEKVYGPALGYGNGNGAKGNGTSTTASGD